MHRQILFSPDARYTGLTRVFSGRLARSIRNRMMEELQPHAREIPGYPVQTWFNAALKRAAIEKGRTDVMSLWAGQAARLLRHRDAKSLMKALVEETSALMG
jgi:nitronate monooxygenase